MSPCPDLFTLDDLSASERQKHLVGCKPCSALFALRAGASGGSESAEEFGEECQSNEVLIAVTLDDELSELDQKRMTCHLASCRRCASLATELLLVESPTPIQEESEPMWKHANEMQMSQVPANDQHKIVFVGVCALAAAVLILLLVKGGGADGETQGIASASAADAGLAIRVLPSTPPEKAGPEKTQETPAEQEQAETIDTETKGPERKGSDGAETEDRARAVGASRPAPEVQKPPAQSAEELLKRAKTAIKNRRYAEGYDLCRAALEQEPNNQEALMSCVIAACNQQRGKDAARHFHKITNSQRRLGLTQICISRGAGDPAKMPKNDASPEALGFESTMTDAKAAIKDAQYGKGLKLARMALQEKPGDQNALVAAVIAACNLKRGAVAKKYFNQIKSPQRRNGLKQICISLGAPGFVSESESESEFVSE